MAILKFLDFFLVNHLNLMSCILVVFTRAGEGEFHEGVLCGGGEEVRVVQTQGFRTKFSH